METTDEQVAHENEAVAPRICGRVDKPQRQNSTIEKFHLLKWKEIARMQRIVASMPAFASIRLDGNDRSLYEVFYRAFPREMVTRARFTSVLRSLFTPLAGEQVKRRAVALDHAHAQHYQQQQQQQQQHSPQHEPQPSDDVDFSHPKDPALQQLYLHLDRMNYLYELNHDNVQVVNWRLFLSAYHMLAEPLLTLRDHLAYSFSLYSSSSFLELQNSSCIEMTKLVPILTHFIPNPHDVSFVCEQIRQAETLLLISTTVKKAAQQEAIELEEEQLASSGYTSAGGNSSNNTTTTTTNQLDQVETTALADIRDAANNAKWHKANQQTKLQVQVVQHKQQKCHHHVSIARLRYDQFRDLLDQRPLRQLFEPISPYACVYEHVACPLYRSRALQMRKKQSDLRKSHHFRVLYDRQRMLKCFARWQEVWAVRKKTRQRIESAMILMTWNKKHFAFDKLVAFALQSLAAIDIQRVFRGMRGRQVACQQQRLVNAACCVQRAFRRQTDFVQYIKRIRRQNVMAIRIQRVYRGRVGRIIARQTLLSFFYSEMEKIQQERQAFREFVRSEMVRVIQRFFHRVIAKKREREAQQQVEELRRAQIQLENEIKQHVQSIETHKRQVTAQYDAIREQTLTKQALAIKLEHDKRQVLHVKRAKQWALFRAEREQHKERLKQSCTQEYNELRAAWQTKNDARVNAKRELLLKYVQTMIENRVLVHQQDRVRAKQLADQIKARQNELVARYKTSGLVVPQRDVEERAQMEIIDEEVGKEQQAANEEWIRAEAEYLHKVEEQQEAERLQSDEKERRQRERSALKIQCIYRMHAAQKILHQETIKAFVKEYDPVKREAVYRNQMWNTTSKVKPIALRTKDLEYADKWIMLKDDVIGEFFYYNPKTMIQRWEKPYECRFCEVCTREFASYLLAEQDTYLCQSCFQQADHQGQTVYSYDGSKPKGG